MVLLLQLTAVTTANAATTTASNAVTTANGQLHTTANTANTNATMLQVRLTQLVQLYLMLFYLRLVANLAAIPGSPSNNDYVEIG